MGGSFRVGACQTPEILGDTESALEWIADFAAEADGHGVDLLLFPEGFLQGYPVTEQHVGEHALDLTGAMFASLLRRTQHIEQTLVLGVIERDGSRYFNTAVVTRAGELVGAYRKTHLTPGECLFHAGDAYPTFQLRGVRFRYQHLLRHAVRRTGRPGCGPGGEPAARPSTEHDAPGRRDRLEGQT